MPAVMSRPVTVCGVMIAVLASSLGGVVEAHAVVAGAGVERQQRAQRVEHAGVAGDDDAVVAALGLDRGRAVDRLHAHDVGAAAGAQDRAAEDRRLDREAVRAGAELDRDDLEVGCSRCRRRPCRARSASSSVSMPMPRGAARVVDRERVDAGRPRARRRSGGGAGSGGVAISPGSTTASGRSSSAIPPVPPAMYSGPAISAARGSNAGRTGVAEPVLTAGMAPPMLDAVAAQAGADARGDATPRCCGRRRGRRPAACRARPARGRCRSITRPPP